MIVTFINIIVKIVCSLIFLNIFYHVHKDAFKIMVIASLFASFSSCFQLIYLLNQNLEINFIIRGAFEAAGSFLIIFGMRSFLLEIKSRYLYVEGGIIVVTIILSYLLFDFNVSVLISGSIHLIAMMYMIFVVFLKQQDIRGRLDHQSVIMSLILITYGLIFMITAILLIVISKSDTLVIDILLSPTFLLILVYFIILENSITNKIKTSLIDNYSHDIGNSNQIIFSSIEYLLSNPNDKERKEVLLLIDKEIERINVLITDIRGLK